MNLNSYEAKVIGKEIYLDIAKRNNMLTKKWTYGRYKQFKKEIREAMNIKGKKPNFLNKVLKRIKRR